MPLQIKILTYRMAFNSLPENDSGKLLTRIDLGISKKNKGIVLLNPGITCLGGFRFFTPGRYVVGRYF